MDRDLGGQGDVPFGKIVVMIAALSLKCWVFWQHHSYVKAIDYPSLALGGGTEKHCAASTGGYDNCASTGYKYFEIKNSKFRKQALLSNIRRLKNNLMGDEKLQHLMIRDKKHQYISEAGTTKKVPH